MDAVYESPFRALEAESSAENFEPETPFLDTRYASESWQQRESPPPGNELEQQWATRVDTPFISQYDGEAPVNLEAHDRTGSRSTREPAPPRATVARAVTR